MTRLYERGHLKLQKDMNIIQMVKRLKYLITFFRATGQITKKSIWINSHSPQNVINGDDENVSSSNTSDCDKDHEYEGHNSNKLDTVTMTLNEEMR